MLLALLTFYMSLVLPWFLICASCRQGLRPGERLLCEACQSALVPAPPLCPRCASPAHGLPCESACDFESSCASYTALYLLVEPGYSVLKAWKKSGGTLLDERIVRWPPGSDATRENALRLFAESAAIVPIPQRIHRSWKLGRSPAGVLARWLSHETHLPVRPLLLPPAQNSGLRQAQRSVQQRMENPLRFRISTHEVQKAPITSAVLVDDFMTSGRTIQAAAQSLTGVGVRRIDVFCVGLRPRLVPLEKSLQDQSHLLESRGRPVTVG